MQILFENPIDVLSQLIRTALVATEKFRIFIQKLKATLNLDYFGYKIVMHVHDEVI